MMKVLLFTHSQDIDGIGCIVLAKEAFSSEKLTYVPCKTFEITSKVNELYQGKKLLEYDLIFVTDLCIKEPLLSLIDNDKNIVITYSGDPANIRFETSKPVTEGTLNIKNYKKLVPETSNIAEISQVGYISKVGYNKQD